MRRYEVLITDLAENDIEASFLWWSEHRSAEEAERWLESIYPAISSLKTMPDRCSRIEEATLYDLDLRQLLFGIGKRPAIGLSLASVRTSLRSYGCGMFRRDG